MDLKMEKDTEMQSMPELDAAAATTTSLSKQAFASAAGALGARMSRRRVLRSGAALGVAGLSVGLLAACGDDDEGGDAEAAEGSPEADAGVPTARTASSGVGAASEPTTAATEAGDEAPATVTTAAEEPTAEATEATEETEPTEAASPEAASGEEIEQLRIAYAELPPQMNPHLGSWIVTARTWGLLMEGLIFQDWANGGELVPRLATEWEYVDDLTLDVQLRDDVIFHNGEPMTAEDVAYCFARTLEGNDSLPASGFFPLESAEAVDTHTVRFVTPRPIGALVAMFASTNALIMPKGYLEEVGDDAFAMAPVGTGPFALDEFDPDIHVTLNRHEAYWGEPSIAKSVIIRAIPEASTRVAALMNDEVDLIFELAADQVEQLGDGFTIDSVSPLNCNTFNVNGRHAPTSDPKFRQALSLSINREAIVRDLLGGHGLWVSSIQSQFDPMYLEREPLPFDLEQAKALLAETDYAGEELTYIFDTPNYYPLQREWSEAIVSQWAEIGINFVMKGVDVTERVTLTADHDMHLRTDSTGVMTDQGLWRGFNGPESSMQRQFYSPGDWDDLDAVIAEAEGLIDADERAAKYAEAIDILNERMMVIPLFTINRIQAMKSSIVWAADPEWALDFRGSKLSVRA